MTLRWLPIILFATLVLSSCDGDSLFQTIAPPAPALTIDELVVADCYVIRDALEAYAADNGGNYPWYPGPPFGPYLPGGDNLVNHYTGRATVPVWGVAQWPGEIGVFVFFDENADPRGYRVVGRGRNGELIRLENVSDLSPEIVDGYDLLIANTDTLVVAVRGFFQQAGVYPADTAGDETPSGQTLMELLPGGRLLTNAFSDCICEPQDGFGLGIPGAIGYLGWSSQGDGLIDDFAIEAYGLNTNVLLMRNSESPEDEWVRSSFRELKYAVERFNEFYPGTYPGGLDVEDPAGHTLRHDYIGNQDHLNPYTGTSAYRDGVATSRGEVGYLPVEENGVVVGYIINALGLFGEELERFEVRP